MFEIGNLVKIASNPGVVVKMKSDPIFGLAFNHLEENLVLGKVIQKFVYHIVIECEDGKIIEGDMDELTMFRGLVKI